MNREVFEMLREKSRKLQIAGPTTSLGGNPGILGFRREYEHFAWGRLPECMCVLSVFL